MIRVRVRARVGVRVRVMVMVTFRDGKSCLPLARRGSRFAGDLG